MIDVSTEDVEERFRTIDRELAAYGAGLELRPQALVLNKIDLLPEPPTVMIDDPRIVAVFSVSCATGAGIEELKRALFALCPAAPRLETEAEPELPDFLDYRPKPAERRSFRIYRTDRGFRVIGDASDPVELEAALRAAGVRKGQDVEVGEETLEWQ